MLNRTSSQPTVTAPFDALHLWHKCRHGPWSYVLAALCTLGMTAIIAVTKADSSIANPPMLYMLAVQAVALVLGSRQAVFASFLSFLEFDWFFVDPRYQFTVRDPFEFVALFMFLITANVTGHLTALLRDRADDAQRRELAAEALAEASWTIVSEPDRNSAVQNVVDQLEHLDSVNRAALLLPDSDKTGHIIATYPRNLSGRDFALSDDTLRAVIKAKCRIGWHTEPNRPRGVGTDKPGNLFLPIIVDGKLAAIWNIQLNQSYLGTEDRRLIESLLNHIKVVLHHDELMQSQAEARALAEVDRLKTALLQMVSHDFRSPLASIKASVGTVLDDIGEEIDTQTLYSMLQAIENETDRLNRMVGNILDLSRLQADAWRPRREMTSIADLVSTALDALSQPDGGRIEVSTKDWNAEIWIDSVQIAQVLRNLFDNALKYSPNNEPVKVVINDTELGFHIEVTDSGSGLPPGDEQRIFEPFYRATQHQESAVPGMGIGLAICKGLVEAHGGWIRAFNRPEGGAVFSILLPRLEPPPEPEQSIEHSGVEEEAEESSPLQLESSRGRSTESSREVAHEISALHI